MGNSRESPDRICFWEDCILEDPAAVEPTWELSLTVHLAEGHSDCTERRFEQDRSLEWVHSHHWPPTANSSSSSSRSSSLNNMLACCTTHTLQIPCEHLNNLWIWVYNWHELLVKNLCDMCMCFLDLYIDMHTCKLRYIWLLLIHWSMLIAGGHTKRKWCQQDRSLEWTHLHHLPPTANSSSRDTLLYLHTCTCVVLEAQNFKKSLLHLRTMHKPKKVFYKHSTACHNSMYTDTTIICICIILQGMLSQLYQASLQTRIAHKCNSLDSWMGTNGQNSFTSSRRVSSSVGGPLPHTMSLQSLCVYCAHVLVLMRQLLS